MKVTWVISQSVERGLVDADILNSIAPTWGSWLTREGYKTENCICIDTNTCQGLLKQAFHAICNFYMPNDSYVELGQPQGVKLFDGQFKGESIANKDDIVALNIAVPTADIVLLYGFNLGQVSHEDPRLGAREAYYFNVAAVIADHPSTQFVLVDYEYDLDSQFLNAENLTHDTLQSVRELLA